MSAAWMLCLGSTLSALVGLLALVWGGRRERWRLLWVLIAAVLMITAGFGAAEAVYQMAVEREEERQEKGTPISDAFVEPTPWSSPTVESLVPPAATRTPIPTALPRLTSTAPPSSELRPSASPQPNWRKPWRCTMLLSCAASP